LKFRFKQTCIIFVAPEFPLPCHTAPGICAQENNHITRSLSSFYMNLAKQYCILLADDDDDDTFLFREALEQIPVKADLIVAENGMKLMDILNGTDVKPDLIFLDMNMPVKNGLECLEEIRESDELLHVPVVILSTSVADYPIESAFSAGANLYIQKPTSFSALVDTLKKCILEKSAAERSVNLEQFLIKNTSN